MAIILTTTHVYVDYMGSSNLDPTLGFDPESLNRTERLLGCSGDLVNRRRMGGFYGEVQRSYGMLSGLTKSTEHPSHAGSWFSETLCFMWELEDLVVTGIQSGLATISNHIGIPD